MRGRAWCGSDCGDFLAVSMRLSSPPDLWTLLWTVLLFNAMGCIQSIRCKPKSFRDSVIVLEVNSSIDPNPTSIDESSSVVLRYRTPHFRACARVLVPPVAGKETWTIGWIQACNHMEFYNTYGNKGMWVSGHLFIALALIIVDRWWAAAEHIWLSSRDEWEIYALCLEYWTPTLKPSGVFFCWANVQSIQSTIIQYMTKSSSRTWRLEPVNESHLLEKWLKWLTDY